MKIMRSHAHYVGSGRDDNGIPCKLFIDTRTGATLRAYDFELLRKHEEEKTRNALNAAHKQGDTKAVSYHKRRFVRR